MSILRRAKPHIIQGTTWHVARSSTAKQSRNPPHTIGFELEEETQAGWTCSKPKNNASLAFCTNRGLWSRCTFMWCLCKTPAPKRHCSGKPASQECMDRQMICDSQPCPWKCYWSQKLNHIPKFLDGCGRETASDIKLGLKSPSWPVELYLFFNASRSFPNCHDLPTKFRLLQTIAESFLSNDIDPSLQIFVELSCARFCSHRSKSSYCMRRKVRPELIFWSISVTPVVT